MRIFITGGAGFIGSHLAEHHLKKGDEVWILDNLSTGLEANITPFLNIPTFKFSKGCLSTWNKLDEAVAWADRVYHMAAKVGQFVVIQNSLSVLEENIRNCMHLLNTISRVNPACHVLIASSSEVYGSRGETSFTEDSLVSFPSGEFLQTNYSLSKFANEMTVLSYCKEKGLHGIIARLFNTIGSRQRGRYGMVVPRFLQQALKNAPLTVYGSGRQTRSFCNVYDTVQILDTLMKIEQSRGHIFNVGNDEEISIKDLAEKIKKHVGSQSELVFIPYEEAYGIAFKDTLRRRPDLTKLRQWIPQLSFKSLDETLQEML